MRDASLTNERIVMWDDVSIGEVSRSGSAIKVFEIEGRHGISQNRMEYWISQLMLDGGMKIAKNTEEGETLTGMIKDKSPLSVILGYLNQLYVRNCDSQKLQHKIAYFGKNEYERGRRDKALDIREALGIE